jgi:hypothetical protein
VIRLCAQILDVPAAASGAGVLQWSAAMLAHVLRPTDLLARDVRAARSALGLRPPLLGVHVRFGDACSDWSRPAACAPRAEYAAAAREMRRRYGVTRVFVATDDGGAAAALAAALGPDGMEARAPPSRLWGARRGRSAAAGLAGGSGAETLGPNAAERALGISFERFGGL